MLFDAGLSPSVLHEPDLMIPVGRVGRLLQASASMSGNESFGLCIAEPHLLSNLGAAGLLLPYQALLNDAQSLAVEEYAVMVIMREVVMAQGIPVSGPRYSNHGHATRLTSTHAMRHAPRQKRLDSVKFGFLHRQRAQERNALTRQAA